ncbi:HAMP domain-containing sensor histidine kinase [Streptomyces sp. NPDC048357]|uniref:sensor histidine kinase n=1 Tax=Streptomyces sp. NPDC048357 TaxID=3154719 RepID=UPI00341E71F6
MRHLAPRRLRSLRWRISLLAGGIAVLVAGGVGALVHQVTKAQMLDEAHELVLERAQFAARNISEGQHPNFVEIDPPDAPPALREQVLKGRLASMELQGRSGPEVWGGAPANGRLVVAVASVSFEYRELHRLDATMAAAGGLAVAVAVPLGALIAGRMSRRLREAAATARRIADGELDARIGGSVRPGDEIAELSAAVDSMAAALQTRLHSEQRFTADVAHELRTPLMGLATSAELLSQELAADYVRDRVKVLGGLVEDLLEVSRLDAGVEQADLVPCPLGSLVADCVHRTGLEVELRAGEAGGALVHTDPRRVDRVLANLVANAHRHGAGPVVVTVGPDRVTVRDHGPGYPDALLAEGPRRFRTGAAERGRGHGLGLTIARGQAEVAGAELAFSNAPDGGAVATLVLPAADPAQ